VYKPSSRQFDSTIISAIPEIFSVFDQKSFRLLYRGSRDGYRATAFHNHCDGRPNTVTLISSTNDCIFGGYTPIAWTSRGGYISDPSLSSFVFTIKNPHNLRPQIFKQQQVRQAIGDYGDHGPVFAGTCDLVVADHYQSANRNWSNLGGVYRNDTGIDGDGVLTGAHLFTVKEIEVFQVI
jgi:hypothetical protein